MRNFDDLEIFSNAYDLSISIERELRHSRIHWSFANELRRSINSVADNIAEGCAFSSDRMMRKHCYIALGSLTEAQVQHRRLRDLGDMKCSDIDERSFNALRRQILGFIRHLDSRIQSFDNE